MNKKQKTIIIICVVVLLMFVLTGIVIFYNYYQKQKNIKEIYTIYSEDNIQNRLENEESNSQEDANYSIDTIVEQKNGKDTLGVLKINAIGYEGLVYEGTTLDILAKGVGHFENTAYFEGNVCMANHNTINQWAKLHTLKLGNVITYTSFLGTKEYEVKTIKEIEETDWNMLRNTSDNMLTLITCVRGKPNLRLCVQAIEK